MNKVLREKTAFFPQCATPDQAGNSRDGKLDQPTNKSYPPGDFPDKALNATVGAYYRSIRNRIFLREAAGFCAVALFLAGGIVLSWRLAFPGARRMPMVCLSIGLVIAAAAAAMYRAARLAPSKRRLVVWLDARIGGGGFLASSLETDCSAWADRIRVPRKPGRILKFSAASLLAVLTASRLLALLTGAVFLPAALLVDTGRDEEKPGMLDTREEIEELEKDLAILEQEPLVRKEEIAEIGEALEKVQAESKSTDPARTFEAIDAIRDQIAAHAVNAALSKEHSAENMKRLSQAATALAGLQAGGKDRIKGTEQFLKLAEKLAEDDALLKDFLKENADLVSNLKPEQLMELAKMMDLQSVDLRKSIDELKRIRTDTMPQLTGPDRETGLKLDPDLNNTKEFRQWLQDNAPGANELIRAACQNAGQEKNQGQTGMQGNPPGNASGEPGNDSQGNASGEPQGNPPALH